MIEAIISSEQLTACRVRPVLGIIPGEGIGPEVMGAAVAVLDAVEGVTGTRIERITAEVMAKGSGEAEVGRAARAFCGEIFQEKGVVLCGPLGGRCVYDLRREFELFCKLAPIRPSAALLGGARVKPEFLAGLDIMVVRDNAGGIYQGSWAQHHANGTPRRAEHAFAYTLPQVEQIVGVGVRLAQARGQRMHVVVKEGGVPTISALWREVAEAMAGGAGVECVVINADYAAYQLMQHPGEFGVLVTPNLLGDMLADLAAVFLGSRGMSYSANFAADGRSVYQTGHGAAKDLAGTDRANPLAQILSLAMLLEENFGMGEAAGRIRAGMDAVLGAGYRTFDLVGPGARVVGTQKMGELVARAVAGEGL